MMDAVQQPRRESGSGSAALTVAKGVLQRKARLGGAAASDGGKVAVAQHTALRKQLQLAPVTANAAVARLEHKVQQLEVLLNGEHGVASPFVLMLKLFVLLIGSLVRFKVALTS